MVWPTLFIRNGFVHLPSWEQSDVTAAAFQENTAAPAVNSVRLMSYACLASKHPQK